MQPMESTIPGAQVSADPYNWPHDASLSPQTTAVIIVDMQRDCRRIGEDQLLSSAHSTQFAKLAAILTVKDVMLQVAEH